MQNKITILDPHEAIKIAAGEVIERPANIIKELLENSIDAQATTITIHLQAAGKDLIKIVDNGCGMSPADAKLCFAHHATSKIKHVNDLNSIVTYGFRGEALSSIAAISTVELMTKTEDDKVGTHIKIEHSKFIDQESIAHHTGTTFIIKDLFSNIPARKKFLKSDDTEWNQIVAIFQAFCLRYLNINFKLFHNDHLAYNCPATEMIATRCAQLWSNNLFDQLVQLPTKEESTVTISGVISTPHYYRFNRGQIFTFVNNRWVKNQELAKGIIQGYDGSLPHQKYPAAFVFVTIDPELIDVNIHPKKEEVKFLHPTIVQRLITKTVQEALSSQLNQTILAPKIVSDQELAPTVQEQSFYVDRQPFGDKKPSQSFWSKPPLVSHKASDIAPQPLNFKAPEWQAEKVPTETTPWQTNSSLLTEPCYTIIGQLKKTYIMIQQEDELIMIDQHAAHERIIYQRLLAQQETACVQLMFAHIIKLSAEALSKLHQYQYLLMQHGIKTESFSDDELMITATPVGMQAAGAQEIILMVSDLAQQEEIIPETIMQEKILSSKACKMACKAGNTLDALQMQQLIKELMTTENRFCCPHGRPTMWNMTFKEIEKHFKRDYVGNKQNNMSL